MYKPHESFQPVDDNAQLWRYMDLPQFMSVVLNSCLFFPRANTFEDPWEGCYPDLNFDIPSVAKQISPIIGQIRKDDGYDGIPDEDLRQNFASRIVEASRKSEGCRKNFGVSCWHQSDYDSELFWKIYGRANYGIAIQTSFGRLKEAFQPESGNVYIGEVSYVDYKKGAIPFGNLFYPILHKRVCYEYEREVRAVVMSTDDDWNSSHSNTRILPTGFRVQISLESLIERILISPYSAPWFCGVVQQTLERLEMTYLEIQNSALLDKPSRT